MECLIKNLSKKATKNGLCEPNGHTIEDVTWPWRANVVTPKHLEPNVSKKLKTEAQLQMTTNRKRPTENGMVMWPSKVKVMTPLHLRPIILKKTGDAI